MMDFLFKWDRVRLMFGVWLGVYPAALILTYLLEPYGFPTWLSVLISTALSVPLITYVVVPLSKEAIAAVDQKSPEEVEG